MSAPKQPTPKHGSGHWHPPELRERAVRMVEETIKQTGERHGVVTRVAVQLGPCSETLRHWVKQAEVDNGQRPLPPDGAQHVRVAHRARRFGLQVLAWK